MDTYLARVDVGSNTGTSYKLTCVKSTINYRRVNDQQTILRRKTILKDLLSIDKLIEINLNEFQKYFYFNYNYLSPSSGSKTFFF